MSLTGAEKRMSTGGVQTLREIQVHIMIACYSVHSDVSNINSDTIPCDSPVKVVGKGLTRLPFPA